MVGTVELLVMIVLAVALGQCLAWLVQLVAWRSLLNQVLQLDRRLADRAPFRSFWGKARKKTLRYVRRRPRYRVHCPVLYQSNGVSKNGVVVDMSSEGWRIKGRGHIPVGTMLNLAISIPENTAPIPTSRAVVRWSEGEEFGVSLIALDQRSAVQKRPPSSVPTHLHRK
jgi:hypothetical protein